MKRAFLIFAWCVLACICTSVVLFAAIAKEPAKVSWNSAGKKELDALVTAHKGSVIVIDVWASWCGPCRQSMPDTIAWSKQHPNLVVLTVSLDKNSDDGLNFLKRLDATKSINLFWTDPLKSLPYNYPNYIPYLILLDKNGKQYEFSESKMLELLKE